KNKDQQLQNHLKKCRHVWHGPVAGPMPAPARHGLRSSSYLRRGIDKEFFNPARRDQAWLRQRFRLPDHHTILLSVGRLDASKNIHVVADSVRIARDNGLAVHWLAVGQGAEAGALRQKLGPHITLPGMIEGKELAKTYASADIFLFPAVHEITPNVVLEAKASGLPCLLASGSALYVARSGHDAVLLPDVLPPTWAAEIGRFAAQPKVLEAIGLAARRDIDDHRPSWADVIQQDLLPVWLAT
ncbi:MAG: glycosyltransferase, partial [Alphaproteobacteria bacterium]|nr:glycosyltransferase [Alphaproteobacteria bacterium]